jgi:hypothetical protein
MARKSSHDGRKKTVKRLIPKDMPTAEDLGKQMAADRLAAEGPFRARARKPKQQLFAVLAVFRGNNTTSEQDPMQLPFTRPLNMAEIKTLWEIERALNSLPVHAGTKVVIDVVVR